MECSDEVDVMKLAVFGATGGTGQHIVRLALEAGHDVVALARTPAKLPTHERLTGIQGDILDGAVVEQVVAGTDAVISALAPPNNQPDFVISQGMDHILAAMQKHDVKRIVVSAGAGVVMPKDQPTFVSRFFGVLLGIVSKNVVADMEQVVEKVVASDREWVVARAPRLTDQSGTGDIIVGYMSSELSTALTREDFARFMLAQVEGDEWLREAPALSNK